VPVKAGEFVLGYRDEIGGIQTPLPEVLGRNSNCGVFRKLHQDVAAFRYFCGTTPPVPRTRNNSRPGSAAAGAAELPRRAVRSTTTPLSAPTRTAATRFCTSGTILREKCVCTA
jgi:hypothetical protein